MPVSVPAFTADLDYQNRSHHNYIHWWLGKKNGREGGGRAMRCAPYMHFTCFFACENRAVWVHHQG